MNGGCRIAIDEVGGEALQLVLAVGEGREAADEEAAGDADEGEADEAAVDSDDEESSTE